MHRHATLCSSPPAYMPPAHHLATMDTCNAFDNSDALNNNEAPNTLRLEVYTYVPIYI